MTIGEKDMSDLLLEYADKIRPILPLAKKAYGSRTQLSPEHEASRAYTELLVEFAYPGIRRRVIMKDVDLSQVKPRNRATRQENIEAVVRVKQAKEIGIDQYHDQLSLEYRNGVSLSVLARELGLSSAAPLYYGVQSSLKRNA